MWLGYWLWYILGILERGGDTVVGEMWLGSETVKLKMWCYVAGVQHIYF